MEELSREYGWTPSQIRKLTIEELNEYLNIISARKLVHNANAKKQS